MPLSINNAEADALTRKFAAMTSVGITEAIVVAMKEAIARLGEDSPEDTAVRLREKYAVNAGPTTRRKLPKMVFEEMWDDSVNPKR